MLEADLRDRVSRAIRSYFETRRAVGSIAGVLCSSDPEHAWVIAQGTVCEDEDCPPNSATVFQVGSITKTVTATALATACTRGALSLRDDLEAFAPADVALPTYRTWNGSVPMRFVDVATHTGGLLLDPHRIPCDGYSSEDMYEYLQRYELALEPGTHWCYSNLGFGLLAQILVTAGDLSAYEDLVRSSVKWLDLSLPDTTVALDPSQMRRLAQGYSAPETPAPLNTWTWPALEGSGGLYSTLDDMLEWIRFNLGWLGSDNREVLDRLHTVHFNDGTHRMGLAWEQGYVGAEAVPYWGKGGATNGFAAFIAYSRDAGVGVAILTNSAYAYPQDLAVDVLGMVADRVRVGSATR